MDGDLREAAIAWLRELNLPESGYVLFCEGKPFWWAAELVEPSKAIAGVTALRLEDGKQLLARGGNAKSGAVEWVEQPSKEAGDGRVCGS